MDLAFAADGSLLVLEGGGANRVRRIASDFSGIAAIIDRGTGAGLGQISNPSALAAGPGGAGGSDIFVANTGEAIVCTLKGDLPWAQWVPDVRGTLVDGQQWLPVLPMMSYRPSCVISQP